MDSEELRELAKQLREGALADIWYDTVISGDPDGTFGPLIDQTQQSMTSAADFLDRLAELIE